MSNSDSSPTSDPSPDNEAGLSTAFNFGHSESPTTHPEQIGPYKILSVLGEGGMGIVYVGEQRTPVNRRVAIKVIKLGMDTREVVARFEAERQALAMMDHPNIARVYDAGATEAGRPFFAMELVTGVPISRFCDSKSLSTAQRLELFALVCDAIQHAHTKGIIHRDLKPGNILVAEVDGKPVPKVIDFGVAKATSQRLTERTLFTQFGRMVGTPEYMSPEQAEATPLDVDARSDVYSLGVVLYELLTGALPFDGKELRSAGYSEIQRIIREVEPPRPSTKFVRLGERAAGVATKRRDSVHGLSSMLRRELEWIPLKAMRKERETRYRTVSEMADDVRNYLRGRPLIAGPESRVYRAKKFLHRNRAAVAAALVMLLLLIAGVVTTSYQAVRASRAEKQALLEKQHAEARFNDVRRLAKALLFELHPMVHSLSGSTGAVRKIVDMSLAYLSKLEATSSKDPGLVREVAAAYDRLGDIQGNNEFKNVGDTTAARESYDREYALAQQAMMSAPNDPASKTTLAIAELKRGDMLALLGKRADALKSYQQAKSRFEEIAQAEPDSFRSQFNALTPDERITEILLINGEVATALADLKADVEVNRKLAEKFPKAPQSRTLVVHAMDHLADAQRRSGDFAGAAESLRWSLAEFEKLSAADPDNAELSGSVVGASKSLARTLMGYLDNNKEAAEILKRAMPRARRAYQVDPNDVQARLRLAEMVMLSAKCAWLLEEYDRATPLYGEAIALYRKAVEVTPDDESSRRMLIVTLGEDANLKESQGKLAESIRSQQLGLEMLQPLLDADPNSRMLRGGVAFQRAQIARTYTKNHQLPEALENARGALTVLRQLMNEAPSDAQTKFIFINSNRILLSAIQDVVMDKNTTPDMRHQLRDEASTAMNECTVVFDELKSAKRLAPDTAAAFAGMQKLLAQINDDALIGHPPPPTTEPD